MASEELGILALVQALSTDEGTKARALELLDQMQQVETGKKQIEQTRAEAEEMMGRVDSERAAVDAARAEAQIKDAALTRERDGLTSAMQTHQAAVDRFNEMRAQIEAEHTTREAAVSAREAAMDEHEQSVASRHAALAEREQKVAEAEAAHAERQQAAQAVIDAAKPFLTEHAP